MQIHKYYTQHLLCLAVLLMEVKNKSQHTLKDNPHLKKHHLLARTVYVTFDYDGTLGELSTSR